MIGKNTLSKRKFQAVLAITPEAMSAIQKELSRRQNKGLTASYKGLATEAVLNYFNPTNARLAMREV